MEEQHENVWMNPRFGFAFSKRCFKLVLARDASNEFGSPIQEKAWQVGVNSSEGFNSPQVIRLVVVWEELRLRLTERFRYRGWQTCPGPTSGVHGEYATSSYLPTGKRMRCTEWCSTIDAESIRPTCRRLVGLPR